jgi:hypothetical protein
MINVLPSKIHFYFIAAGGIRVNASNFSRTPGAYRLTISIA